jgi:hypothetical protein
MTAPNVQIITLDGPTLAEAIPLDLCGWDAAEGITLQPVLREGWRQFIAQLATAVHGHGWPDSAA